MNKNKIKLVASDLDGTLLTTEKKLTKKTENIIYELQKQDIVFVPATGRVLSSVPEYIKSISSLDYIITSNGAATNHIPSGKEILSNHLSANDIQLVLEIICNKNIMVEIFSKGQAYSDKLFLENLNRYGVVGTHANYTLATRKPVDNIFKYLEENCEKIENINLIFPDLELRKEINNILTQKNFASITSSSSHNLEITSLLATKGQALKILCQMLDISMDKVMCFGDSENDSDMLRECGYSFAMANSSEYVKSFAKYSADSCDNEGVAKAIEKFIFSS